MAAEDSFEQTPESDAMKTKNHDLSSSSGLFPNLLSANATTNQEQNTSYRSGPPRVINHNFSSSLAATRSIAAHNANKMPESAVGFPFEEEEEGSSFRGPYDGMPSSSPRIDHRPASSRQRGMSWLSGDVWNPAKIFVQSPRTEHSSFTFNSHNGERVGPPASR